ncbi:MAG: 3,4-dihydroxy-2-butanone-4-phosphate synthase, partial [Thermoplasmata archaeon]|nr:3,4-dihydroxy-2-butanone-4-phosphate synthase [Thermoplasmata archaeon]
RFPLLRTLLPTHLPYDTKSAFSITVNHRESYTGITDDDRGLAISSLGELVENMHNGQVEGPSDAFTKRFRAPGHLHLLRCSPGLLNDRQGHTELSTFLCMMAGIPPSAAICEMMGKGKARSMTEARAYGESKGYPFLEGKEILEAWKSWSE